MITTMKKLSLIYLLLFFSNKANAQSGCTDTMIALKILPLLNN